MKENRVRRILQEGGLALGTHVGGIADPQIVELIGLAGFDAAFIDMEHTSFDPGEAGAQATAQSERIRPWLVANRFQAISQASMMSARLINTELASQWLRR